MTIQMAAQRLGKSESTIRRWIREGKLEATKVKDIWDIPEQAVDSHSTDYSPGGQVEAVLQQLRNENQYLRTQLQEKDEQIRELHQMVGMEQAKTQQLVQRLTQPFWRRWRRRKELPEATLSGEDSRSV